MKYILPNNYYIHSTNPPSDISNIWIVSPVLQFESVSTNVYLPSNISAIDFTDIEQTGFVYVEFDTTDPIVMKFDSSTNTWEQFDLKNLAVEDSQTSDSDNSGGNEFVPSISNKPAPPDDFLGSTVDPA